MITLCAWCTPKDDPRNAKASHGLCPECEKKFDKQLEEAKARKRKARK